MTVAPSGTEIALVREELEALDRLSLRRYARLDRLPAIFDKNYVRDRRIEDVNIGAEIARVRDDLRAKLGMPPLVPAGLPAKQQASGAWAEEYDADRVELRERFKATV